MQHLLAEIKKCTICSPFLAHGVNPVVSAHSKSKIAIIGQAPGSVVHKSGIPWKDKSGERLRQWLDVGDDQFYDPEIFAIIPMGFCYPGKGKSGDLPPRPECAEKWHKVLFDRLNHLEFIPLIGTYAQQYYLQKRTKNTLTETVRSYKEYLPQFLPLPHPSPSNNIWLRKNEWFEDSVLAALREQVIELIK